MGSEVFQREATGLVKSIGPWNAFWLNAISSAAGGIVSSVYIFQLGPVVFPGGDYSIAFTIDVLGIIAIVSMYAFLTAMMPRSGGDYVFVSRTLNPIVGFFSNLNFTYWVLSFWGFTAFLAATYFSRLMGDFGESALASWSVTPTGLFVLGSIFSILTVLLLITGMKNYFRLQNFVLIYTLVAFVAVLVILGLGASNFHQSFNTWATTNHAVNGSDPYQSVISAASSAGFTVPGFTWAATLGLVPILWSISNLQMSSSYLGGEIRNAQSFKRHVTTMAGAAVIGTLQLALIAYFLVRTVGYQFLSSLVYSSSSFPSVANTYDFFVRILTPYMVYIDIGFFIMSFLLISINALIVQRSIFAWSFDRLVPTALARVSDRFHTPVINIVVSLLLAEILVFLFAFTSATALYAASTFGLIVTFTITAIAVGSYPYRHKAAFEASAVKYRVVGIPLMTISAILSILFMAFMSYYFVSLPVLSGFSLITLETLIVLLIVSAGLFYGSKAFQKSKGIDISLEFKEIPPE